MLFFLLTISILANIVLLYLSRRIIYKLAKKLLKKNVSQNQSIKAAPVAYYCYNTKVERITAVATTSNAIQYSGNMVLQPELYNINGFAFDLQNEGLYRILFPFQKNYQVIVYQNDLFALLSGIAWIVSHGNADNKLDFDALSRKAANDKLYLTCGYVSPFAKNLLSQFGYNARIVSGMALHDLNEYDCAHVMIEVFHPQLNKWILADIANNCLFGSDKKEYLNLPEFRESLHKGTLEIKTIASDTSIDISGYKIRNNYSFGIYMEMLQNQSMLKDWYKRVMNIIFVEDHFFDTRNIELVKKYSDRHTYMEAELFFSRFYN